MLALLSSVGTRLLSCSVHLMEMWDCNFYKELFVTKELISFTVIHTHLCVT